eukprot:881696-Prymnesium_polylepis.1
MAGALRPLLHRDVHAQEAARAAAAAAADAGGRGLRVHHRHRLSLVRHAGHPGGQRRTKAPWRVGPLAPRLRPFRHL